MLNLLRIRGFVAFLAMALLNAFVDFGHKLLLAGALRAGLTDIPPLLLDLLTAALLILPFALVAGPAGRIADATAKPRVLRGSALALAGLTALAALCYARHWYWAAMLCSWLVGLQAAQFAPAKYAYVKELTGTSELSAATGATLAMSYLGLLGAVGLVAWGALPATVWAGPALALIDPNPVGWCLLAAAALEAAVVRRLPAAGDLAPPDTRLTDDLRAGLRRIRGHSVLWLSVLGLAVYGAILLSSVQGLPALARGAIGIASPLVTQGLVACIGIGLVAGALLAGSASRHHIETGFVPLGAFGLTACLGLMPALDSVVLAGTNLIAYGVLGGLFAVPLLALVQYDAPDGARGRVLAASNFIQSLLAFLCTVTMAALLALAVPPRTLFIALAVIALAGSAYTVRKLPQALVRSIASRIIAQRYRIRVIGFEHMPQRGGVLMLGNHISWIDWAVLQMACPRQIRFVMERSLYERWYLRWFLDSFGVIPISGVGSRAAFEQMRECLNNGEVVGLFPEGGISRTGHLGEFKRGYENSVTGAMGVIVPFYLRGLWGSSFSRSSARLRLLRSGGMRRDIVVAFGRALPLSTPADELKRRVFELSIDSWEEYTRTLETVPVAWLATAKRLRGDMALADTVSGGLSGYRVITGVLIVAGFVRRLCAGQNVGLLLPTSNGGAIANLAVLLCGKTVVNLNYTASRAAVQAALASAGITTVFTSSRFLERLQQREIDGRALLEGTTVHELENLAAGVSKVRRVLSLLQAVLLPKRVLLWLHARRVRSEDPAAILFSSGSEGEPKGVVLSHRNVMSNIKQISDVLNTEDNDVMMGTLPLFHSFGLTVTTFMPLVEGIPVACHPDPTDAVNVAKAVATYRGTILMGTSTFLRLYARSARVHPLMFDSLRIVVSGAEKLQSDVREAFKIKFQKEIYEGYGATETTPVASVNIPDRLDTLEWKVQIGNKPGTVGMPLPGSSFRIVDPVTLAELPTGEDGLILIGGTQVMLGYLGDSERTAQVIVELDGKRWYRTGDKGHLDDDGFLTIVDRYSRFAKIGGEMVSLGAVEELVRKALGDPELDVCAVAMPDPRKGEQIMLLMAGVSCTPDEVRRALAAAGCPPLTIPGEFRAVAAVPKLGSGKTDFSAARRLAESVL